MSHTARASVAAQRWKAIFEENVLGNEDVLRPAVQDIFYGDQVKIPRVPAICVEPGIKTRSWPPAPTLRTENTLEVNVFVYWAQMTGNQETKLLADEMAETLEEFMNANYVMLPDADGNPLVIHGHVVENEPGYLRRTNLYHASRLLWRAITKTQLNQAG